MAQPNECLEVGECMVPSEPVVEKLSKPQKRRRRLQLLAVRRATGTSSLKQNHTPTSALRAEATEFQHGHSMELRLQGIAAMVQDMHWALLGHCCAWPWDTGMSVLEELSPDSIPFYAQEAGGRSFTVPAKGEEPATAPREHSTPALPLPESNSNDSNNSTSSNFKQSSMTLTAVGQQQPKQQQQQVSTFIAEEIHATMKEEASRSVNGSFRSLRSKAPREISDTNSNRQQQQKLQQQRVSTIQAEDSYAAIQEDDSRSIDGTFHPQNTVFNQMSELTGTAGDSIPLARCWESISGTNLGDFRSLPWSAWGSIYVKIVRENLGEVTDPVSDEREATFSDLAALVHAHDFVGISRLLAANSALMPDFKKVFPLALTSLQLQRSQYAKTAEDLNHNLQALDGKLQDLQALQIRASRAADSKDKRTQSAAMLRELEAMAAEVKSEKQTNENELQELRRAIHRIGLRHKLLNDMLEPIVHCDVAKVRLLQSKLPALP